MNLSWTQIRCFGIFVLISWVETNFQLTVNHNGFYSPPIHWPSTKFTLLFELLEHKFFFLTYDHLVCVKLSLPWLDSNPWIQPVGQECVLNTSNFKYFCPYYFIFKLYYKKHWSGLFSPLQNSEFLLFIFSDLRLGIVFVRNGMQCNSVAFC